MLGQIESYDNLIPFMVEALKSCTDLSNDVMSYCIINQVRKFCLKHLLKNLPERIFFSVCYFSIQFFFFVTLVDIRYVFLYINYIIILFSHPPLCIWFHIRFPIILSPINFNFIPNLYIYFYLFIYFDSYVSIQIHLLISISIY